MKYAVIDDTTSPFLLGRYSTLERAEECEPMKTLEDQEIISGFLGDISFSGQRQADGTLKSYTTDCVLNDWPTKVAMCGHILTLETVEQGKNNNESAVYV
jgi:hypothetical protein